VLALAQRQQALDRRLVVMPFVAVAEIAMPDITLGIAGSTGEVDIVNLSCIIPGSAPVMRKRKRRARSYSCRFGVPRPRM
jgi:hypothetical protein